MATCTDCDQEMLTATSCTADTIIVRGQAFTRFRVRRDWLGRDGRCPDCGAKPGGFHHLGCDVERCPSCRRQLISCSCGWVEDEDEGEVEALIVVADGVVVHPPALRGLPVPPGRFPFGNPGRRKTTA